MVSKEAVYEKDLQRKLKKSGNVLIIGVEGSGKTNLMRHIEESYAEVKRAVVVGTKEELGIYTNTTNGKKSYTTKKGNVFFNYGETGVDEVQYPRLNPDWLMYDGVRDFTDLYEVFKVWSCGTSIIATMNASGLDEADTNMNELGAQVTKVYGMEMDNWLDMFTLVIEVRKGWDGTPYEVIGVYDIR